MSSHEVAVAIIQLNDRVLLRYNADWGVFSFPMCSRKQLAFADEAAQEPWIDAAARAVAECLGRTSVPEFLTDIERIQFSDRDGVCKSYHFGVFRQAVDSEPPLVPGVIAEWIRIPNLKLRRPLSATVSAIVDELHARDIL